MKNKYIVLFLAACVLLSCLGGCAGAAKEPSAPAETADTAKPDDEEKTGWEVYDEVYASRDPGEVVLKINGREVTWELYFYRLSQVLNSLAGEAFDWRQKVDAEHNLADIAKQNIEAALARYCIILEKAEEHGIALSEESKSEVDAVYTQQLEALGNGNEADFAKALKEYYLSPESYRWLLETSALYADLFVDIYGDNGENISDDAVMAYVEETGYMHCMHILLQNTEPGTDQPLEEEALAEKRAAAEKLLVQLREVDDDPAALCEKFQTLMKEHTEDPGLKGNPNGYYFTPNEMVTEFSEASAALDIYGLSDIVESTYGYHIILRLPVEPDDLVDGIYPLRYYAASAAFTKLSGEWFADYEIEYMPEFADLDFAELFS